MVVGTHFECIATLALDAHDHVASTQLLPRTDDGHRPDTGQIVEQQGGAFERPALDHVAGLQRPQKALRPGGQIGLAVGAYLTVTPFDDLDAQRTVAHRLRRQESARERVAGTAVERRHAGGQLAQARKIELAADDIAECCLQGRVVEHGIAAETHRLQRDADTALGSDGGVRRRFYRDLG